MSWYNVTFTQEHTYLVEAEDEDQAEDIAYEEFASNMRSPIANTSYDSIEIEELEEEEGNEEY